MQPNFQSFRKFISDTQVSGTAVSQPDQVPTSPTQVALGSGEPFGRRYNSLNTDPDSFQSGSGQEEGREDSVPTRFKLSHEKVDELVGAI